MACSKTRIFLARVIGAAERAYRKQFTKFYPDRLKCHLFFYFYSNFVKSLMHLVLGRFNRSHSFIAPASENEGAKRPPFADQMNIETDFYKTNASRLRSTEFLI